MIRSLTRLTERISPRPLRDVTAGPLDWWLRCLRRFPAFYHTLYDMRRFSPPAVRLEHVHLEATNGCNLHCRGCNNRDQTAPRGMMPLDLARRVIDEAYEAVGPACILGFYIRGESTLNPELGEMIRYAHGKGMRRLLLSTNLICIDQELARELLTAGLSELRLSIDGASKESLERLRRGADFTRITSAVATLQEERRRLGSRCHFRLHAAIDEAGFLEVPLFVRRWDGLVDSFTFTVAVNQGGLHDDQYASRLSGLAFAASDRFQIPCRILYNYAGVTWDGKITSCCVDYGENFVAGTIEEGLVRAFQNRRSRQLRSSHAEGRLGPLCRKCGFANALVDWFEDDVNQYVETYRCRLMDASFDAWYREWLRRRVTLFNRLAAPGGGNDDARMR